MAKQQKVSLYSFFGDYNPIHFVCKKQIIFKSPEFVYKQVNTENSLMKEYSLVRTQPEILLDFSLVNMSVIVCIFRKGGKYKFSFLCFWSYSCLLMAGVYTSLFSIGFIFIHSLNKCILR